MGGPVSRACIVQNYDGCRDKVSRLFTLGSPHAGLAPGYILPFDPNAQPGLYDLSKNKMKGVQGFNGLNRNLAGISYMFLGGDAWFGQSDKPVERTK